MSLYTATSGPVSRPAFNDPTALAKQPTNSPTLLPATPFKVMVAGKEETFFVGEANGKMAVLRPNASGGYIALITDTPAGKQPAMLVIKVQEDFRAGVASNSPREAKFLVDAGVQRSTAAQSKDPAPKPTLSVSTTQRTTSNSRFNLIQGTFNVTPKVSVTLGFVSGVNSSKGKPEETTAQTIGLSYKLNKDVVVSASATALYNQTNRTGLPFIAAAKVEYAVPIQLPGKTTGKLALSEDVILNGDKVTARTAGVLTLDHPLNQNFSATASAGYRAAFSLTGQPSNYQTIYNVGLNATFMNKQLNLSVGFGTNFSTTGLTEASGQTPGLNVRVGWTF